MTGLASEIPDIHIVYKGQLREYAFINMDAFRDAIALIFGADRQGVW